MWENYEFGNISKTQSMILCERKMYMRAYSKNYIYRLFIGSRFHVQNLPQLSLELQDPSVGHDDKQPQVPIMN